MADIRSYIRNNLLDPLKLYPTAIQDTMLEIIIDRLEELYNYTLLFPEIVSPNKNRLDVLRVIADQFLFTIRDDADLQEQINILTNILHVYNRRGSIDTIENMWKYYGGQLPKDVQVVIPSYNLFRWDISEYSGDHVFQDGELNRTGLYEIRLINSTYPIPDLKKFLLKELVAAGNLVYFKNIIFSDLTGDNSHYLYNIYEDDLLQMQMSAEMKLASKVYEDTELRIDHVVRDYLYNVRKNIDLSIQANVPYIYTVQEQLELAIQARAYCTSSQTEYLINHDSYNAEGERVKRLEYFYLGTSLLGVLNYEVVEEK